VRIITIVLPEEEKDDTKAGVIVLPNADTEAEVKKQKNIEVDEVQWELAVVVVAQ